jgi:hypothetical protein
VFRVRHLYALKQADTAETVYNFLQFIFVRLFNERREPMKVKPILRMSQMARSAFFLTLLVALLLGSRASAQDAPAISGNINKIYVTDVTDVSFQVSWTTDSPNNNSSVNFGTSAGALTNSAPDDITVSSYVHTVYVSHGSPNTDIYFEVVSGGETDNNGGAKYKVTSGAILGVPPSGYNIKGTVYKEGGVVPAPNVIVFIQLQPASGAGNSVSASNSQWVTALTASNGTWIYNLGQVRTENAGAYYNATYGQNMMRIDWQGGIEGNVGEAPGDERIYVTPSTFPGTYDITLDKTPTAVKMVDLRAYNDKPAAAPLVLGAVLVGLLVLAGLWLGKSRASKLVRAKD